MKPPGSVVRADTCFIHHLFQILCLFRNLEPLLVDVHWPVDKLEVVQRVVLLLPLVDSEPIVEVLLDPVELEFSYFFVDPVDEPAALSNHTEVVGVQTALEHVHGAPDVAWVVLFYLEKLHDVVGSIVEEAVPVDQFGVILSRHALDTKIHQKLLMACQQSCCLAGLHHQGLTQAVNDEIRYVREYLWLVGWVTTWDASIA